MSIDQFDAADDILTEALEADAHHELVGVHARGWRSAIGRLVSNRDIAILLVAILLFAFFDIANSRMASDTTLVALARRVAPLGIVAAGMTYLFVPAEIDLSVGGLDGLLIVFSPLLIPNPHVSPRLA